MRNFVIWFQHRSGSTHLVSLLNSHPEIQCKGEIFGCFPIGRRVDSQTSAGRLLGDDVYHRVINQFPGRIDDPSDGQCVKDLEQFFGLEHSENDRAHRIRGFKLKFPSQSKLFPEIANWLTDRNGELSVIALHRKNYLRRALSVLNLHRVRDATDQANLRVPRELPPVNFDVLEVIRLIEYYGDIAQEFEDWSNSFEHSMEMEYEDLIYDPETVSERVQRFLGVKKIQPLKSSVQRITPNELPDFVSNFDELRNMLLKKGLDRYL